MFVCSHMPICACAYTHVLHLLRGPQRPEEGIRCTGTRVVGGFESLSVYAGNQTHVLGKSKNTLLTMGPTL